MINEIKFLESHDNGIFVLRGEWDQGLIDQLKKGITEIYPNKKLLLVKLENNQSLESISEQEMLKYGWIKNTSNP